MKILFDQCIGSRDVLIWHDNVSPSDSWDIYIQYINRYFHKMSQFFTNKRLQYNLKIKLTQLSLLIVQFLRFFFHSLFSNSANHYFKEDKEGRKEMAQRGYNYWNQLTSCLIVLNKKKTFSERNLDR